MWRQIIERIKEQGARTRNYAPARCSRARNTNMNMPQFAFTAFTTRLSIPIRNPARQRRKQRVKPVKANYDNKQLFIRA